MFSTVIDISLIFVQSVLENFGKTVRDPPPFITFARVLLSLALLDVTANSSKKFVVSVHEVTKMNRPHSLNDDMLTQGHKEADILINSASHYQHHLP